MGASFPIATMLTLTKSGVIPTYLGLTPDLVETSLISI